MYTAHSRPLQFIFLYDRPSVYNSRFASGRSVCQDIAQHASRLRPTVKMHVRYVKILNKDPFSSIKRVKEREINKVEARRRILRSRNNTWLDSLSFPLALSLRCISFLWIPHLIFFPPCIFVPWDEQSVAHVKRISTGNYAP